MHHSVKICSFYISHSKLLVYIFLFLIQVFRKGLTRMFSDNDEDIVFMETSMHLKKHPHMVLEAVPMPREVGDMAPIYFKVKNNFR